MIGQRIPVRWKERQVTTSRAHDVAVVLNTFTLVIVFALSALSFVKTYELAKRVDRIERLIADAVEASGRGE
jgi:hypothetical protein